MSSSFVILDLRSYLQHYPSEKILSDLSFFKSRPGSEELCQFLQETTDKNGVRRSNFIDFEKKHLCRVYFVLSENADNSNDENCVLNLKNGTYPVYGYFTISVKTLYKDKIFSDQDILPKENINVYLIGHLCKNDSYAWKDGGLYMLQQCFEIIESVHQKIGVEYMLAECEEELVKYYSEQHFKKVGFNQRNNLAQMIRKVAEF
jgi:hypothetical protein